MSAYRLFILVRRVSANTQKDEERNVAVIKRMIHLNIIKYHEQQKTRHYK